MDATTATMKQLGGLAAAFKAMPPALLAAILFEAGDTLVAARYAKACKLREIAFAEQRIVDFTARISVLKHELEIVSNRVATAESLSGKMLDAARAKIGLSAPAAPAQDSDGSKTTAAAA